MKACLAAAWEFFFLSRAGNVGVKVKCSGDNTLPDHWAKAMSIQQKSVRIKSPLFPGPPQLLRIGRKKGGEGGDEAPWSVAAFWRPWQAGLCETNERGQSQAAPSQLRVVWSTLQCLSRRAAPGASGQGRTRDPRPLLHPTWCIPKLTRLVRVFALNSQLICRIDNLNDLTPTLTTQCWRPT